MSTSETNSQAPPASSIKQHLEVLREAIGSKTPYCSGTCGISSKNFILFYGKDELAHRLDLASATEEQLERLSQACDVATFGVDQQDVHDESYRKAGKLDQDHFATSFNPDSVGLTNIIRSNLLEGHDEKKAIHMELYKLNVYGKGSFFKAHKDTPRAENMFGSLVVVFPSRHEGGSLILRHDSKEWSYDSAKELSNTTEPSIGYVAFYSDVEHEVAPVQSGYRVTITYNLYFANESPITALPACENGLLTAFEKLLLDETFLPAGGSLGFGLRHQYPLPKNGTLSHLSDCLKGSDAVVMRVCQTLSLSASVCVTFEKKGDVVLLKSMPSMPTEADHDELGIIGILRGQDYTRKNRAGQPIQVSRDGDVIKVKQNPKNYSYYPLSVDREVFWVTKSLALNREKKPFLAYGNEASLDYVYGDVCLIVSVGPLDKRATIETVAPQVA
ncbi:hypothetical protein JAAARDRAFT_139962 [Jaapia argillacea MUCL 33604]|uniref:Prolyl 4-hydroxylase alpha subunit Fe(2+) 2OG dioxygenase domain-containing protein n=1 Tax=Jaapia argillacea MUCL 33604 TaxID=933084 RepID=A0A067PKN0_9AGAM|nr:hypothetical protein JAAARDRAFT_139962 [Jaapia argillacea MUCL 33604]